MSAATAQPEFIVKPNANPMPEAERLEAFQSLGFGTLFSDHMAVIQWNVVKGWHSAEITARGPFAIDPAAAVLHYAQEIFEGMKAYRTAEGRVVLFRPDENARRFNESARRMAMPEIPEELFLEAIDKLVKADAKWIPEGEGSLYLRPFMFASEAFLGVRPARDYIFCVIASPVGPYFKGGAKAVKIWVSENYTRAAPGGTGAAKCGGNYAASLIAQQEAVEHGCDQVAFLDAAEHKWLEELGGMNVFFVMDDGSLVTPPLGGTILPGITRNSLISLLKDQGMTVHERPYSFEEWQADAKSGKLKEAFACGTAAVVAGIGEVKFTDGGFVIGNGETGPTTLKIREQLVNIQRGQSNDPHGWVRRIDGI
ncbi:branched-chain amino acid aminotransferase [Agrobacterium vitis]|uniref:Branched-chain-amino-acid aminotransferase n=1 Tax=Agrobacterium vitis TaxID=373 RepID=A0ABD6G8J6_AGRVI|nr:branched-chain amino acid aminotransferase [Agrobacterium vitis]MUO82194.1 branched-chain amino acid aminotransferase [Agrobacterium vitis]MUO97462.1 branched-chain amino acid aminotransferase [Agrobacterium vitis]MUP05622.1 branched-chain amino acid aminotransferase [Agrobacterium vitis]MUZ85295.1 branched-chain amino acid aminotransferase [Agrobacterium vitis]MVA08457.1 branched-chain amino acid aminotransferase [Agrobacterium vitis]